MIHSAFTVLSRFWLWLEMVVLTHVGVKLVSCVHCNVCYMQIMHRAESTASVTERCRVPMNSLSAPDETYQETKCATK